jgi:hypothetical protein
MSEKYSLSRRKYLLSSMRKRVSNALLNLALFVSAITSLNVCAQTAGTLDPSFNGTGYIGALPISASELTESGERLLLQPDGKILAAGQCDATPGAK